MKTSILHISGALSIAAPIACFASPYPVQFQEQAHPNYRMETPLRNAGVSIDVPSLISTLRGKDKGLAARAAYVLPKFQKTAEIVNALRLAAQDDDEYLSLAAMYSLLRFGDDGWIEMAIKRLPQLSNPTVKLQVAGFVARAGRTEGWQIVVAEVERGGIFVPVALDNFKYFDGKKDRTGAKIDIRAELKRLLTVAPKEIRPEIQERLTILNSAPSKP